MRKYAIQAVSVLLLALLLLSVDAAGQKKGEQPQPEPKYKVGDVAPDFTLKDQTGKDVSLHDFRGKKNVALAFYVFAFTGG